MAIANLYQYKGKTRRYQDTSQKINAPRINLHYKRGISANLQEVQYMAQYGDGYTAYGAPGLNKTIEEWNIETVPMCECDALKLREKLLRHFKTPFEWLCSPSGAKFKYYYIVDGKIETMTGYQYKLKFKIQNWRNLA